VNRYLKIDNASRARLECIEFIVVLAVYPGVFQFSASPGPLE
jgi:hypothetical protein